MPDNGLANLAGALLCAGHETLILDYGTVENVEETFPSGLSQIARETYESAVRNIAKGIGLTAQDLERFSLLDGRLTEAIHKRCQQVAEQVCKWIERLDADFVGFKLWNGDGFWGSIDIAERVKSRYKNVKIFAGGAHVDIFGEDIFRVTNIFDVLAYGEGEETIVQVAEFAEGKRKLLDVNNVIFKDSGGTVRTHSRRIRDLNALPLPCYDAAVYPAMEGDNKLKIVVVDESRGCPFKCHFCIHPIKSGSRVRTKKPDRVIGEMRKILEEVGTRAFRYAGSATPPKLAGEIAALILRNGLEVEYSAFGNASYGEAQPFEDIARSGCRSIFFGIESGSKEILGRSMGKAVPEWGIGEAIKRSREAGVFTVGSIIFPAPFETGETERETIELLAAVRPDAVVVQFPIIYPGTKWAVDPAAFGLSFDDKDYAESAMTYKAKPLMPSLFWDDLPFSLNGKDFKTVRLEAARFTNELEKRGILTSVSDDLALIAGLAGYRGKEREFRDLTQSIFFCGDVEQIAGIVAAVNGAATPGNAEKSGQMMERTVCENPERSALKGPNARGSSNA
jgi:radical SAM superfamily enzyme YgiQ (UPF0313 family)